MPRPTKAIRRIKLNAADEWKKGNHAEAHKLWAKAAGEYKTRLDKKRNKNKPAEGAAPAES